MPSTGNRTSVQRSRNKNKLVSPQLLDLQDTKSKKINEKKRKRRLLIISQLGNNNKTQFVILAAVATNTGEEGERG
jgi:hypothetical protein